MDHQACFDQWCQAIEDGHRRDARMLADHYNEWIRKGGFMASDRTYKVRLLGPSNTYIALTDWGGAMKLTHVGVA